jgi:uncharacterized protein YdaU (DUF1376 family)
MTKKEFFDAIPEKIRQRISIYDGDNSLYLSTAEKGIYGRKITLQNVTVTPYSKRNLEALLTAITPELLAEIDAADAAFWASPAGQEKKRRQVAENRAAARKARAMKLASEAGLNCDEHGGYRHGSDSYGISVLDIADAQTPAKLREYHATGDMLLLVEESRTRTYAGSSKWKASTRYDRYLVGRNENGVPFAHAVKSDIRTIAEALNWIWNGEKIIARQGDVATAESKQFSSPGQIVVDYQIIDSHRIDGEIRKNGALYARNARLYHEKGQHPDITIGDTWAKIVIGRRSTKSTSTVD